MKQASEVEEGNKQRRAICRKAGGDLCTNVVDADEMKEMNKSHDTRGPVLHVVGRFRLPIVPHRLLPV